MDTRGSVAQSRSVVGGLLSLILKFCHFETTDLIINGFVLVVFSNLMNDYNQYRYHSEGLTLVIKKFENIHRHERSRRQARGKDS